MKSVVVTGVSSGIGRGTAKVLVEKGFHVFGSVRKAEDAKRLSDELGNAFTPLLFDITDERAVHEAAQQVRDSLHGETLFGLVNNAGVSAQGPLAYLPVDQYRHQLEVNLVGPFIATQAFVPLLGMDRSLKGNPGRIINISSVGGKLGGPFIGAYHASKFGLEGFSDSLRRELLLYGIDVIVIGPGSVATATWDKAEEIDVSRYEETEYAPALEKYTRFMIDGGRKGYSPERLGKKIWKALTVPHPRVRYAVVPHSFITWTIPLLLPKRLVDTLIANSLGLQRK
ncbi:SDR family oxidoreductase [Dictyobacter arantiisoli]|uniref:Oxidoreductase n=1 Tax=Dictyobacter arantiisoli TaxID=2014874 RepID=A0A5A5T6B4_9CHLR|nr:SDR family oxidoreductase [Dictyobacter arantiisoli]GCF06922.1 oxidoreductase [Dictyobacter arantiisoli]